MNAIALLKREEEQATLGTPPAGGKLTHYQKEPGRDFSGKITYNNKLSFSERFLVSF